MKIIIAIVFLLIVLSNQYQLRYMPVSKSKQPSGDFDDAIVTKTNKQYQIIAKSKLVRIMNVPDVFQATDYTCGPSSLTAVLNYYGFDKRQIQLAKIAKTNQQVGTDPVNLLAAIQQLGFKGEMHEEMGLLSLQDYLNEGRPVILLLQAWRDDDSPLYPIDFDDGHYVVAIGHDNDYIYFEDPWVIGSLTYMTKSDLLDRWHGNSAFPSDRHVYGVGIIVLENKRNISTVIYLD